MEELIRKHERTVLVIVFVLASIVRFIDFPDRWGLAYDQSRDTLIARHAIRSSQLPMLGPFSSAGAFIYGPQWFWFIMVFSLPYFGSVMTPWIIQSMLYCGLAILMYAIGKKVRDRFTGLIAALLTALSPAQISQAVNLTSPSMIGILSTVCLLFFIDYLRFKRPLTIFFLSFFVATSIMVHFQAIGLTVLVVLAVLLSLRKPIFIIIALAGFILPLIPIVMFDFSTNHYEIRNLWQYFRYDQYKIYVPNRWLTYVGIFWPQQWGRILTGNSLFGYLICVCTWIIIGLTSVRLFIGKRIHFLKYQISKIKVIIGEESDTDYIIVWIASAFILMFIWLRYYRGERFDSYYVFTHPLIILLSAYSIRILWYIRREAGVLLVILSLSLSLIQIQKDVRGARNITAQTAMDVRQILVTQFPNSVFSLYDFEHKTPDKTLPLSLFLDELGLVRDNGLKIGFAHTRSLSTAPLRKILVDYAGFDIVDLSSSSSAELARNKWYPVNPSSVYRSTENWMEDEKIR